MLSFVSWCICELGFFERAQNKLLILADDLKLFTLTFCILVVAVFNWVHGESELQMSTFHDGRFDQPKQASAWLQLCRMINSKLFTEVRLTA